MKLRDSVHFGVESTEIVVTMYVNAILQMRQGDLRDVPSAGAAQEHKADQQDAPAPAPQPAPKSPPLRDEEVPSAGTAKKHKIAQQAAPAPTWFQRK